MEKKPRKLERMEPPTGERAARNGVDTTPAS